MTFEFGDDKAVCEGCLGVIEVWAYDQFMTRLLFIFLFGFSSFFAEAQNQDIPVNTRSISVSGTAEKSSPADQVEIFGEIRVELEQLSLAQEKSKNLFNNLALTLKGLGVTADKIELRNHKLGKRYETKDNVRTMVGFYSERHFKITLDDVSGLDMVSESLAGSPEVEITDTKFARKDAIAIRKELRTAALTAAQEKAAEMAEVYGQKIGQPLKISESSGYDYSPFSNPMTYNTRNTGDFEGGSSANGRVSLTSRVEVIFELVSPE